MAALSSPDLELLFLEAASDNDVESVEEYLKEGIDARIQQPGTGKSALHLAAEKGHASCCIQQLMLPDIINLKDLTGKAALHYACKNGHFDCVKIFLEYKAFQDIVDNDGFTACDLAANENHDEILNLFEQYYSEQNLPFIHALSAFGHHRWLKRLLNHESANINLQDDKNRTAVHYACLRHQNKSLQVLLDNNASINITDQNGLSALHASSIVDNRLALQLLIEKGADLNLLDKRSRTALHYACLGNHVGCFNILVDEACNVNIFDQNGRSPLHIACERGNLEFIDNLLQANANFSIQDKEDCTPADLALKSNHLHALSKFATFQNKGISLIHQVCAGNHSKWLESLLESQLNVNLTDANKQTPLHYACFYGHKPCIDVLLAHDADREIEDKNGKTALQLAWDRGYNEIYNHYFIHVSSACSETNESASQIIPPSLGESYPDNLINNLENQRLMNQGQPAEEIGEEVPENELEPDDQIDNDSRFRGIFLLINNFDFNGHLPYIYAGDLDTKILKKTFRKLKYKVVSRENLSADKIREEFEKIAQDNHTEYDSFVCALLSHGNEGYISGINGRPFEIQKAVDIILDSHCLTLKQIPKVFIIEACRGIDRPSGQQYEQYARAGSNHPFVSIFPNAAGFFYLYATVKGFTSEQDPRDGSLFIKSFCNNVCDNHRGQRKIYNVHLRTNSEMKTNRSKEYGKPYFQIGEFRSANFDDFSFDTPDDINE